MVKSDQGSDVVIPTTAAMGFFDGQSAGKVRTDVREQIQAALKARKFKSEIFVVTGGDWAWGSGTT